MRILVITPYPPFPPLSGGRKRIWRQIQHLSAKHDVDLLSLAYGPEELGYKAALEGICSSCCLVLHSAPLATCIATFPELPQPVAQFCTHEMIASAKARSGQYDLVICQHIYTAPFGELMEEQVVIEEHNIESEVLKRQEILGTCATTKSNRAPTACEGMSAADRLAHYERRIWGEFNLRIVVSERDRHHIIGIHPDKRTEVVPNAVDLSTFEPTSNRGDAILFMGTLNYEPNVDGIAHFCNRVWPLLRSKLPEATLIIAGANPRAQVRGLEAIAGVRVVANPLDIRPLALQSAVAIVPLRSGGGTRIKILEAFALGLPVISTSIGAEGLAISDRSHLLIADEPDQFARSIANLLKNRSLANRLRDNALTYVRTEHDFAKILPAYEALLVATASQPNQKSSVLRP